MTPTQIRALLDAHGLRPSKALGQNFLADTNMAQHIARLAGVGTGDRVVEVGPGLGGLTLALTDAGAHVLAVELDRHLLPVLAEVLNGRDVEVVNGDAMTTDWSSILHGAPWAMVANLPYNVATPVVVRALEIAPAIDRFLVMVQREVGERLAAPAGTDAYGAVSVKVAYYGEADVVGIVPPSVFVPKPRIESALVRIVRRTEPPVDVDDPDAMFSLVRAGFATRRKTLRNALTAVLGPRSESVLLAAGIDPRARAETLDLEQWAALSKAAA